MNESSKPKQQFSIQKIYIKDASFESPEAPQSFRFSQWNPKVDLNLANDQAHIDGDSYEVVLSITVTVAQEEKTAFLIEVHQAGLFEISGFDDDQRRYLLGSQCMNILFPYAREAISDLSVRGGFPPVTLSPVNFDGLYQQHLKQKQAEQAKQGESGESGETEAVH
jgi:preprotein translocase subunit SecB